MSDERVHGLVEFLQADKGMMNRWLPKQGPSWAATYARRMLDDPQGLIDALVEAGVLRRYDAVTVVESKWDKLGGSMISQKAPGIYYAVVPPKPPHKHNWVIRRASSGSSVWTWICDDLDCLSVIPIPMPPEEDDT